MSLPICRHRGPELSLGRWQCSLPIAPAPRLGVSAYACNRCLYPDWQGEAPKPQPLGPGDMLHWMILQVTGQGPHSGCQCAARMRQMNELGWLGCWRRWPIIAGWLKEEADLRGVPVEAAKLRSLLRAALREWRRLRKAA